MKKFLIIIFVIPLFVFSHQQDERLFATSEVKPGVMILLDRSLSMDEDAVEYDTTEVFARTDVVLNDFGSDASTELEGWYDSEIFPDDGEMDDFAGVSGDDDWVLRINAFGGNDTVVVNNWVLRIYHSGTYSDFTGNSFALELSDNEISDTISVTGTGIVDSVECYIDLDCHGYEQSWWWWTWWNQTELGEIGVYLNGSAFTSVVTTTVMSRIQSAILVLHSLLDANGDGFVTEEDEEDLSVMLGQGCHRTFSSGNVFLPPSGSYTYDGGGVGGWSGYPASQEYNESTENWDYLPNTTLTMETDTLGSPFVDIWDHINSTNVGGYTPNGMLIGHGVDYINSFKGDHEDFWCMGQNIIIVTDGIPNTPREECNATSTPSNSEDARNWGSRDMVREAYLAYHGNEDTTLQGPDSIRVFAVGFGTDIDNDCKNVLNWTARWGGTCASPS